MQTQAMSQDDFDLAKFIKLMKMTTATVDGEALNAIRMANKMLHNNGHDWEVLLKGKITIIADPFTSIPTPPPPRAAPPPPSPPPPPPQPQRVPRNHADISTWMQTISAGRLEQHEWAMFQAIEVEWNHFTALKDSDYHWLRSTAAALTPMVRPRDDVEMMFDVLDLAPLLQSELRTYREIKAGWTRRANGKMDERDWLGLLRLYNAYKPRGSKTGKGKRLF